MEQVLLARCVINDYIDALGFGGSRAGNGARNRGWRGASFVLFRRAAFAARRRDPLPRHVASTGWWLSADPTGNAGHKAGSEITSEQNKELGDILSVCGTAGAAATA